MDWEQYMPTATPARAPARKNTPANPTRPPPAESAPATQHLLMPTPAEKMAEQMKMMHEVANRATEIYRGAKDAAESIAIAKVGLEHHKAIIDSAELHARMEREYALANPAMTPQQAGAVRYPKGETRQSQGLAPAYQNHRIRKIHADLSDPEFEAVLTRCRNEGTPAGRSDFQAAAEAKKAGHPDPTTVRPGNQVKKAVRKTEASYDNKPPNKVEWARWRAAHNSIKERIEKAQQFISWLGAQLTAQNIKLDLSEMPPEFDEQRRLLAATPAS